MFTPKKPSGQYPNPTGTPFGRTPLHTPIPMSSTPIPSKTPLKSIKTPGRSLRTPFKAKEELPTLLSSDTLSVKTVGYIPPLVLKKQSLVGRVDDVSGYAALIYNDSCMVWQSSSSKPFSFNKCIEFPLPNDDPNPLLMTFVPSSSGDVSQPGLVLISPSGLCRYWENVVFGAESYHSLQIPLSNDAFTTLELVQGFACLLATEKSCVYQLTLWNSNGISSLSYSCFSKSQGVLSRVTSLFGYGQEGVGPISDEPIVGLTIVDDELLPIRRLYVATTGKLQKWQIGSSITPTLILDTPVLSSIKRMLQESSDASFGNPKIQLVNVAHQKDDNLVLLVAVMESKYWEYYLVFVEERESGFNLLNFKQLQLATNIEDSWPDLTIVQGRIIFVIVPDQILICSGELTSEFQEKVPFNTPTVVGHSIKRGSLHPGHVLLQVLTIGANPSLVQIDVNVPRISSLSAANSPVKGEGLQTVRFKIEQAVYFGGANDWQSPIVFDLGSAPGDLPKAAFDVSLDILKSTSEHFKSVLDVSTQISERLTRLEQLIGFLDTNQAVEKLPIQSRLELRSHAEKIAGAVALWEYQNELFRVPKPEDSHENALSICIQNFMGSQEDYIRLFFKSRVEELGDFLALTPTLLDIPKLSKSRIHTYEVNKILLIVLSTAIEYRSRVNAKYQLDSESKGDVWTGELALLQAIRVQFERTDAVLKDLSSIYPDIASTETDLLSNPSALTFQLRNQLADLGGMLLGSLHDRLGGLEVSKREKEYRTLLETRGLILSKVLTCLVSNQRLDDAFSLVERYRDYRAMVELTIQDPANQNERLKRYLNTYGEAFGNILYDMLLKASDYSTLLNQPSEYDGLLDSFLHSEKVDWLSWIHDLKLHNFDRASATLWGVANSQKSTDQQMLALCLSKLAAAEASGNAAEFATSEVAQVYAHAMDFIALERDVCRRFREIIKERTRSIESLGPQHIKIVYDSWFGESLEKRTVMQSIIVKFISDILHGQKVSVCDMIELFTLQVSQDSNVFWTTVIDLLNCHIMTPNSVEANFYLHLIWIRAWLCDPWEEIRKRSQSASDQEVREAIMNTKVYKLVDVLIQNGNADVFCVHPSSLLLELDKLPLGNRYPYLDDTSLFHLKDEYAAEYARFLEVLNLAQLGDLFIECGRISQSLL